MAKTLFMQLKPIAEKLLTAYRDDFFVHDKKTLRWSKKGETFIWVCRANGTHLQRINAPVGEEVSEDQLALSWDLLDALRDMDEVRAIYCLEVLADQHGQITKLDRIPERPEALRGVHNKALLFA